MERTVSLRDELSAGLVAGIAGGVLLDLFLVLRHLAGGAGSSGSGGGFFEFLGAALLGAASFSNSAAVAIGVLVNFLISIGWALGYAYLIRRQPQLLARPWISGAAFGLVVYTFTQIVALGGGYHPPKAADIETALIGNIVFYGIPVALIVSHQLRRA